VVPPKEDEGEEY